MRDQDQGPEAGVAAVEQLARLFLRQAGGYVLTLLAASGRVLSYNIGGERIECWSADHVVGQQHDVFYPPDEIHAGRPRADLAAALRDGVLEREAWRVCENGAEYLARLTVTPLFDAGAHRGFACIARDITDEAAVRASIETREQHLQSILATVPDAMIIIDEAGAITSFSAAAERLFGYREAELIGSNVACLMPEPDRGRHDEYIAHYLQTRERRIIGVGRVVVGLRRDGVDWVMVMLVARENIAAGVTGVYDARGKTLGAFTLADPMDAMFIDDARVFHGVTAVEPADPGQPAYRDVLVATFRTG